MPVRPASSGIACPRGSQWNSTIFAFLVQDGVNTGALYVLISIALIMVFMVTRIVFVPQGELITFTALALSRLVDGQVPGTVFLLVGLGVVALALDFTAALVRKSARGLIRSALFNVAVPLSLWAACLLSVQVHADLLIDMTIVVVIATMLGPLLYRVAFQPMASASPLALLIAALAVHFVLVSMGLFFFGPEGVRTPGLLDPALNLGAVSISYQSVLTIAACVSISAALYVFFYHTLSGKALRATAVNRRGAQLVGIGADFSGKLTFAIAGLIGAVTGLLIAPTSPVYYDFGFIIGLKGFIGAILGGLGSYPLAVLGSLCVGMLDLFAAFWSSAYKEVFVFTLILPLLFWRSLYDRADDHV